ncbi:MAG: hypothetical protein DMF80_16890 [Acidobacteria bacterium]|nr:MAG: hypothetical protein DMF80_16890 [Acidobacteriota bacterium]
MSALPAAATRSSGALLPPLRSRGRGGGARHAVGAARADRLRRRLDGDDPAGIDPSDRVLPGHAGGGRAGGAALLRSDRRLRRPAGQRRLRRYLPGHRGPPPLPSAAPGRAGEAASLRAGRTGARLPGRPRPADDHDRALPLHGHLGGAPRGFEATFRVACYAEAAALIRLVPLCGSLLSTAWFLFLAIVGLSEAHGISKGRAAAAVLLPLILVCCCCAAGILLVLGGFASALGNLK